MADQLVVASPCTGVCRIDPLSGWCEGCLRTIEEISCWSTLDHCAKKTIREELGLRRVKADGAARRRPQGPNMPPDDGTDSNAENV